MEAAEARALTWVGRLFLAIAIVAAIVCGRSAFRTLQFVSESTQAEGTVIDWTQGGGTAGRSPEPGAYYRVIEIVTMEGKRLRGEAETGVGMNDLRIGERLTVRYRPSDPARMRVVSLADLWLVELITAILAIALGASGAFLLKQAKRRGARSD